MSPQLAPQLVSLSERRAEVSAAADATRYRALFRSIRQAFCVVKVLFNAGGQAFDLEFIETNPAFESHASLGDVVGRRMRALRPDFEDSFYDIYGRVATTGEPTAFTMRSDALERTFDVEAFAIDENGSHLVGILFSDVTDRQRHAEVARASRQVLEEVLRKMPAPVCVLRGTDLRLKLANPAYQALAPGVSMTGRTLDELWPNAGRNFESICRRVLETGEPFEVVDDLTVISRSAGGPLDKAYFDWSVHRVRLPGSGRWGLLNVAWDTTARHEAAAALQASELRYRQLFEHIPDGVFTADPDGRYIDVNDAGCAMLAMTRDEVLALSIADVVLPREHHRIPSEIRRMDGGAVTHCEWTFQRKNGTTFIGEVTGRQDREGNLLGVLRDVTEAHRAEQSRLESEERFRVMADGLPLMIWVHDASGELEYANSTYREYFGVTPEQAKGDRWKVSTHPDDADAYIQEFLRCSRERQPFHRQVRVRRADGQWRWIESWARPRWAGDEFAGMVGTSADITKRKATASALKEADRRKDEFLATLSHELRNPLAPIRTAAKLLGDTRLETGQLAWAQSVIQRQVGHMARLLEDLLDVARITQGKLELKPELVSLVSVVDSAVEAARPLLDDKHHRLTIRLPDAPKKVVVDPTRLSQVLSNLLTNSAKYTDAGGAVELLVVEDNGMLRFEVRDNGIGIPEHARTKLFEMFSQIDGARHRSEGGLGIGLALVKGLVDLHGGTVEVQSAGPGHGSTFTVCIPATEMACPQGTATSAAPETSPQAAHLKVLVVDDNADAADTLALLVGIDGHEVRVARGGRPALSMLQTFRPDVAFVDIGMPDLDGYEVARAVRCGTRGGGIHLVAVTGWAQEEDKRLALEAGFDEHLTKPVDPDRVAEVLSRSSAQKNV